MIQEVDFKKGINSFQLKFIGILFMTLDHIGAYTLNLTMGNHPLRILGRIAAPLFLYVIVNSVHHTENKLKFAFRLYIAHVLICLITLFLTTAGKGWFGIYNQFSVNRASVWMFMDFFNLNQFWMILFLPFIYLYNGEKGKSMKYFFYIYYPLHIFILMFIGQLLR